MFLFSLTNVRVSRSLSNPDSLVCWCGEKCRNLRLRFSSTSLGYPFIRLLRSKIEAIKIFIICFRFFLVTNYYILNLFIAFKFQTVGLFQRFVSLNPKADLIYDNSICEPHVSLLLSRYFSIITTYRHLSSSCISEALPHIYYFFLDYVPLQ